MFSVFADDNISQKPQYEFDNDFMNLIHENSKDEKMINEIKNNYQMFLGEKDQQKLKTLYKKMLFYFDVLQLKSEVKERLIMSLRKTISNKQLK
jgi:phospholipid N-methyltransferase